MRLYILYWNVKHTSPKKRCCPISQKMATSLRYRTSGSQTIVSIKRAPTFILLDQTVADRRADACIVVAVIVVVVGRRCRSIVHSQDGNMEQEEGSTLNQEKLEYNLLRRSAIFTQTVWAWARSECSGADAWSLKRSAVTCGWCWCRISNKC